MPRKAPLLRACTRCGSTTNEFGKCSKVSDGKTASCLKCQAEVLREKYRTQADFRADRLARNAAHYQAKPELYYARVKAYQERHKERVRAREKTYREANRPKVYARNAARRKREAAMPWANRELIEQFYVKAKEMTQTTGVPHVVDHVIPLKGKLVSGLHVEHNLQVIPASENARKSNSFTPMEI